MPEFKIGQWSPLRVSYPHPWALLSGNLTPVITFARLALCDLIALERASGHPEERNFTSRITEND